jgi:hypothetical protein
MNEVHLPAAWLRDGRRPHHLDLGRWFDAGLAHVPTLLGLAVRALLCAVGLVSAVIIVTAPPAFLVGLAVVYAAAISMIALLRR